MDVTVKLNALALHLTWMGIVMASEDEKWFKIQDYVRETVKKKAPEGAIREVKKGFADVRPPVYRQMPAVKSVPYLK